MLHIHRAERTAELAAGLATILPRAPGDPFAPEVVAVPTRGVNAGSRRGCRMSSAGPPTVGSGKSALSRRAAGIDPPDSGRVLLDGEPAAILHPTSAPRDSAT